MADKNIVSYGAGMVRTVIPPNQINTLPSSIYKKNVKGC